MRTIFSILLLSTLIATSASAQEQDRKVRDRSGDFAILFDLSGLGNLALNGLYGGQLDSNQTVAGGLGLKFFLADRLALRGGLGFSSGDASASFSGFDTTTSGIESSSTSITFAPAVTYNISQGRTVVGYAGLGIQYVHSSASIVSSDTAAGSFGEVSTSINAFGVGALLGVEWFPWESVSFSAEYTLGYSSSTGSSSTSLTGMDPIEFDFPGASVIGISSRGILTMSFYL